MKWPLESSTASVPVLLSIQVMLPLQTSTVWLLTTPEPDTDTCGVSPALGSVILMSAFTAAYCTTAAVTAEWRLGYSVACLE